VVAGVSTPAIGSYEGEVVNRKKFWVTGVLALVAAGTVVAATPASAAPKPVTPGVAPPGAALPAGFTDWAAVYRYQEQLNSAAGRLLATDPDNASIVAAPGNHELRVYWKGAVPAAARTLAGASGVKVAFHQAAYTHGELVKRAQLVAADRQVYEAAPAADGSGLAVTVAAGLAPAALAGLRSSATVPLTITAGARPRATSGRQADTPGFWGGARYHNSVGNVCTTGIPVIQVGNAGRMLTAGHCGTNDTPVTVPGQPVPTGTFGGKDTCRDTALINFPSGVGSATYTGDQNSSSAAFFSGATFDFVGNLVSAGGASSGEHVNIPIQATALFTDAPDIPCTSVGPLTKAGYSSATCAVALGDSGGPVYAPAGDGTVFARGTISLAVGTAVCPGIFPAGFNTVYWAPAIMPTGNFAGSFNLNSVQIPPATVFNLNGTWTDGPGRGPGPVITVRGTAILVNMGAFHRPLAPGGVINRTVISVNFPDDANHIGTVVAPNRIVWDNGSVWTKL
jgi:hypothetical protein